MKPKATAFTLTLNWPHSLAMVFVRPTTRLARGVVGLAGVAEGAGGRGDVDDLAEHLLPSSRSFLAGSRRCGAAARMTRKGTIVWMSSIAWKCSSVILWTGASIV